ncbi:putative NADP-retinol dehydrogenase [Dioscorea sansibarensis]
MEREAWLRGIWEMVKEGVSQRLLSWHLPSPPFLIPNQLSGLTVIVTGCTSGIGLCVAREMVMAGAHVIMACRNVEGANRIAREWREDAHNNKAILVEVMRLDLLSLASVRSFGEEWNSHGMPLHLLINNAGAFYMKEPQQFTEDGIERHMQVNHTAPALLTLLLLPSLLKAPFSRIINVNSVAHHCALIDPTRWKSKINDGNFNAIRTYGESKLAQLMFLKTLAGKLYEKKITSIQCVTVNPGIVNTNMVKQQQKHKIAEWKLFWMFSPAEGARSVLFCSTNESVVKNTIECFAHYSSVCTPTKEAPQAMDVISCVNVWKKTMEMLDLDMDYLSQLIDV